MHAHNPQTGAYIAIPARGSVTIGGQQIGPHTGPQGLPPPWVFQDPPPPPPETLAAAQARRTAEFDAEAERRFAERWPTLERAASLAGVALTGDDPGVAASAEAHILARDAALQAVAAAGTVDAVNAVTVEWPA